MINLVLSGIHVKKRMKPKCNIDFCLLTADAKHTKIKLAFRCHINVFSQITLLNYILRLPDIPN